MLHRSQVAKFIEGWMRDWFRKNGLCYNSEFATKSESQIWEYLNDPKGRLDYRLHDTTIACALETSKLFLGSEIKERAHALRKLG